MVSCILNRFCPVRKRVSYQPPTRLYRAETINVLSSDLHAEIEWLNEVALKYIKNYQIWHHRQLIISRLDSADGEFDFLAEMFDKDAKNYHVWSYRQWLVKKFNLWDAGELDECERHLHHDIRNNSAWNHRWFVVFGRLEGKPIGGETWNREVAFVSDAIKKAPQNESPWNYLRGLLRRTGRPFSDIEHIALEYASLDHPDEIRSSHALDVLAEMYAAETSTQDEARTALNLLATKYDPIRANYWNYRQSVMVSDCKTD